jgi:hypothetical protein
MDVDAPTALEFIKQVLAESSTRLKNLSADFSGILTKTPLRTCHLQGPSSKPIGMLPSNVVGFVTFGHLESSLRKVSPEVNERLIHYARLSSLKDSKPIATLPVFEPLNGHQSF